MADGMQRRRPWGTDALTHGHGALGALPSLDFETMGPMRPYSASDALMAHRQVIGCYLFDRAMGLFDLQRTVTPYDLADACCEGGAAAEGSARTLQRRTQRLPTAHLGTGARHRRLRMLPSSVRQQRVRTSNIGRNV